MSDPIRLPPPTVYTWTSDGMVPDDWTQRAPNVSSQMVKLSDYEVLTGQLRACQEENVKLANQYQTDWSEEHRRREATEAALTACQQERDQALEKRHLFSRQLSLQEQRTGEWHHACDAAEAQVLHLTHQVEELNRREQGAFNELQNVCDNESVVGGIRNLKQALLSEQGNVFTLEAECEARNFRIITLQESIDGCAQRVQQFSARLAAAEASATALRQLVAALVTQMSVVFNSPEYSSMWAMGWIHGGKYDGPTFEAELEAVEAALAASAETPPKDHP